MGGASCNFCTIRNAMSAVLQQQFSASIFKRGLKEELFGTAEGEDDDVALDRYVDELGAVWSAPRRG